MFVRNIFHQHKNSVRYALDARRMSHRYLCEVFVTVSRFWQNLQYAQNFSQTPLISKHTKFQVSSPSCQYDAFTTKQQSAQIKTENLLFTLSLLMSYIYGAPCKARNFNVVCIWTYVWQRWKPSLSICCTMFQHWINAESYPVAQLCVNTLLATTVTLITDGI
jgi:hypothetical protein